MARTYGAVYFDIWRDRDFRALSHTEKYVYWALIFQPRLNGAGLLDYMPDRWADESGDMTAAEIEMTVKSLIVKRYVVLDESTRELLIRTYVRNSKVWKMPKAFAAVIPAAKEIQSSKLRHVLLADLDKIPLGELSEAPAANGGPSVRAKVDAYLVKLRAVLDDGEPDDPAGLDGSDAQPPQGYLSGADRVSVPNGYPTNTESVPSSTRVRAQAVPVQVHVPVQVPNPPALASVTLLPLPVEPEPDAASPQGDDGALFDAPPNSSASKPRNGSKPKKPANGKLPDPEVEARKKLADELTREWWERLSEKPSGKNAFIAARQIIYGLLEANHAPEAVAEAAKRAGLSMTIKSLEYRLQQIKDEQGRVVVPFQRRGAYIESDDRAYGPLASAFDSSGA